MFNFNQFWPVVCCQTAVSVANHVNLNDFSRIKDEHSDPNTYCKWSFIASDREKYPERNLNHHILNSDLDWNSATAVWRVTGTERVVVAPVSYSPADVLTRSLTCASPSWKSVPWHISYKHNVTFKKPQAWLLYEDTLTDTMALK